MTEPIFKKINSRSLENEMGSSLAPTQKREVVLHVEASALERMKKQAKVTIVSPHGSTFSIICDEGPYLGGDDSAPPPLAYFCAGASCCILTQLSRYATMTKLNIENINLNMTARFSMEGSAIQGTLTGKGVLFETELFIESDEPAEKISKLIEVGEQSCFAMQSIANPVSCQLKVQLNSEVFENH